VVAVCVAVVLYLRRNPSIAAQQRLAEETEKQHIEGINHSLQPVLAFYKAPPGATPCDSCWNGLQAVAAAAQQQGVEPPWESLYDHDTFLAKCNAIPESDRKCVDPQYEMKNRDACNPIVERLHDENVLYVSRPRPHAPGADASPPGWK
jgi:hypothetical protein